MKPFYSTVLYILLQYKGFLSCLGPKHYSSDVECRKWEPTVQILSSCSDLWFSWTLQTAAGLQRAAPACSLAWDPARECISTVMQWKWCTVQQALHKQGEYHTALHSTLYITLQYSTVNGVLLDKGTCHSVYCLTVLYHNQEHGSRAWISLSSLSHADMTFFLSACVSISLRRQMPGFWQYCKKNNIAELYTTCSSGCTVQYSTAFFLTSDHTVHNLNPRLSNSML